MYVVARFGLVFGPAAVGDSSMSGPGHRAEVAQPGLSRRPAVVGWHVAFGVIKIHVLTEAGAEGKDVGDLPGSDGGPQLRRYLIAVDRCDCGGVQHRLDTDLTAAASKEFHQLVEGDQVAVFGSDDRMTGTQCGFGKVEVEYDPGPGPLSVELWRHCHR
jgi:hypothetical protein